MEITYLNTHNFSEDQLQSLFCSVDWESGKHPKKLKEAMLHSDSVYSAWDGDKLVGLINALTDRAMTVYFHYLLVDPEYQGQGIGKTLLVWMLDHYREIPKKLLIAYDEQIGFYENLGFEENPGVTLMRISSL